MVLRDDSGGEFHELDRWEGGVGWMIHPDETYQRTSHAVTTDGGVYVIDPLDCEGLDDRLGDLGEVAGVVVLSSFHTRDAGPVARRHDVPVYVPGWIDRVPPKLPDTVERTRIGDGDRLPGTGYELRQVLDSWIHSDAALYHPDERTLVVGDVLQTAPINLAGNERLGVVYGWRLVPPREGLSDISPDRCSLATARECSRTPKMRSRTPSMGHAAERRGTTCATSLRWYVPSGRLPAIDRQAGA